LVQRLSALCIRNLSISSIRLAIVVITFVLFFHFEFLCFASVALAAFSRASRLGLLSGGFW
jgi:hypothetical protein